MDWRISALTLFCLAVSRVAALTVNIPQDSYEFARGDNITLPCAFVPKAKPTLVVITWSVEGAEANAKENVILTYYTTGNLTDISKPYEGRASLDVNIATGKADLKLSSITLADNKVFECRVQIPLDDEGKPADTARLVVLVAPSVPICKIQGKAEYGQNINLTCKSDEGSPTPTYKWESRDVRNAPRVPAPRTTDKGGVLSLYNISKDTSGYYICTSANKIRSAKCNITLSVMPPSMNLGSIGKIVGIVAAVLAVIIIIVIIYFCCCKKKKEEDEYAMGVRGEEYLDKEAAGKGEDRYPDGQGDTRDRDDSVERSDRYEERSERNSGDRRRDYDDRRRDYDDRRSDYDDRRRDYDDRRSDYDDRRSDYDDRRRDYDDRRSDYDDRRSDYSARRDDRRRDNDDGRSDYSDRRDRYDDRNDRERRYDDDDRRDRRYDDDRYDEPYDEDRERDRPRVPANKPPKRDYDD